MGIKFVELDARITRANAEADSPAAARDSNERDPGAFSMEDERGDASDGKGATKMNNPLATYPWTVL